MHIFSGIIGIIVGFLLIKYSVGLTDTLGKFAWAEKYLGSGLAGTYSMYRIAGVILIILSFMYMFGILSSILGPIAPLFGGTK